MWCRCCLWLLLVLSSFLVSCSGDDAPPCFDPPIEAGDEAEQMLLVYIAGDNNLAGDAQDDLQELLDAAVMVPHNCYLLAFVDDKKNPRVLRFFNNAGKGDYDTVRNFDGELSSCNSQNMSDILEWVLSHFPSKSYDLILWSHGSGWLYDDERKLEQFSFGIDDVNSAGDSKRRVYIEELAAVLEGLPMQPHRLMFDACLMQCVEVAYTLRNSADWIIASPAEIPAAGAPYEYMVPLFFDPSATVQELLDAYVVSYEDTNMGAVLSAVRCDLLEELAAATAAVVKKHFCKGGNVDCSAALAYLPGGKFSSSVKMPDFFDAASVVWGCLSAVEYEEWRSVLDRVVPYRSATDRFYSELKSVYVYLREPWCGISMYMPREGGKYTSLNKDFAVSEWYVAAGWSEAGW